jgi:predicted  nucleic acid-binding Zn-ribbon protein
MQTLELIESGDRMDDVDHKIEALSGAMHAEFKAVRAEMKEEFAAFRKEMKEEFAAVRKEMKEESAAVRAEMREGFAAMQRSFDAVQRSILWLMGTMLVVVASILASTHL